MPIFSAPFLTVISVFDPVLSYLPFNYNGTATDVDFSVLGASVTLTAPTGSNRTQSNALPHLYRITVDQAVDVEFDVRGAGGGSGNSGNGGAGGRVVGEVKLQPETTYTLLLGASGFNATNIQWGFGGYGGGGAGSYGGSGNAGTAFGDGGDFPASYTNTQTPSDQGVSGQIGGGGGGLSGLFSGASLSQSSAIIIAGGGGGGGSSSVGGGGAGGGGTNLDGNAGSTDGNAGGGGGGTTTARGAQGTSSLGQSALAAQQAGAGFGGGGAGDYDGSSESGGGGVGEL